MTSYRGNTSTERSAEGRCRARGAEIRRSRGRRIAAALPRCHLKAPLRGEGGSYCSNGLGDPLSVSV